nr:MAG TPA: hypothetical protein [Caudoviricetes sp.]
MVYLYYSPVQKHSFYLIPFYVVTMLLNNYSQ